jgi:hypothetical protein
MSGQPTPAEIAADLILLHEFKDANYKDAWRKRGELIGIFANIARKYDRLVVARGGGKSARGEAQTDTAADLCVYSTKYVTWLIEHDPSAADEITGADRERWSGTHGHSAVATALQQLAAVHETPPPSLDDAFNAIATPFTTLERILVEQQETSSSYSPTRAALPLCIEQTVPGGSIVFDHVYSTEEFRYTLGERIAAYELLGDGGFFHLHGTGVFTRSAESTVDSRRRCSRSSGSADSHGSRFATRSRKCAHIGVLRPRRASRGCSSRRHHAGWGGASCPGCRARCAERN